MAPTTNDEIEMITYSRNKYFPNKMKTYVIKLITRNKERKIFNYVHVQLPELD